MWAVSENSDERLKQDERPVRWVKRSGSWVTVIS